MTFWRMLAALGCGLGIASTQASACSCGGIRGRTAWETAEKEAQSTDAIFEAVPERFDVQWNILTASRGDWIRVDLADPQDPYTYWPRMRITFRVKRVYKGNVGPTVQVWTGLGGGDCGAHYSTGLDYLVYADDAKRATSARPRLVVSMCSPGGWMGRNHVATELRHLRGERPKPTDLVTVDYRSPAGVQRMNREEFTQRYTAATGQICGVVSPAVAGQIAFLPTIGYSPVWAFTATVDRDGNFCSQRLGPGRYRLQFTQDPVDGIAESALYFTNVDQGANANAAQVEAGHTTTGVLVRIAKQKAYTVHGFISADDKTQMRESAAQVILVTPEGRVIDRRSVDFSTTFPLPNTKYFSFRNVLPGRYIAYASAGGDWLTKVVDVNVTTHHKLIVLGLRHSPANR